LAGRHFGNAPPLLRGYRRELGAILGWAVYSGLVDRSLWRHVRRWAGIMLAVVLVKSVLVIVLGLAAAITAGNGDSLTAVLTGLAILFVWQRLGCVVARRIPPGSLMLCQGASRSSGLCDRTSDTGLQPASDGSLCFT
jgi:hypothetical protein